MTSEELEMKWEEISQTTIEQAEGVDCSLAEYRDGLRDIIASLTVRWNGVAQECNGEE